MARHLAHFAFLAGASSLRQDSALWAAPRLQNRSDSVWGRAPQPVASGDGDEDSSGLVAYLFDELMKKCEGLTNTSALGEVCTQADAAGLVAKLSEKLASADPEVARWLCKAEETVIDSVQFQKGCQDASKSLMTGLKELLADKMNWKVLGRFAANTAQAVTAVVPLPPPLAAVLDKCSNWLLSTLSQNAQSNLAQLEDMAQKTREVVTEEFLRMGVAHARAAQVQVQDMSMMDDLWLEEMNATGSPEARLVVEATSFNRWAVIEQDLATSAEILRPPRSMVDIEERAQFAEVLRVQFQLHLLVLSKMFRAVHGGRNAVRLQKVLAGKAQRAARLLLPDIVLLGSRDLNREKHGALFPTAAKLSMRALSSPLLLQPPTPEARKRCETLKGLTQDHDTEVVEFQYLVTCLWLPLYQTEKQAALPLPVKEVHDVDLLHGNFGTAWTFFGASFPTEPGSQWSEGTEHRLQCGDGSAVRGIVRACSSLGWPLGCRFEGLCAPLAEHGIHRVDATFMTPGLCSNYASAGMLVAVLTAVEFLPSVGDRTSVEVGVKNSTCSLAYRTLD